MKTLLFLLITAGMTLPAPAIQPATCSTPPVFSGQVFATICAPAPDATVDELFLFSGAVSSPSGIHVGQLYIDGKKYADYFTADIEVTVRLKEGRHRFTLQAIDNSGAKAINTQYITVR